jgi:hypothetical protein
MPSMLTCKKKEFNYWLQLGYSFNYYLHRFRYLTLVIGGKCVTALNIY